MEQGCHTLRSISDPVYPDAKIHHTCTQTRLTSKICYCKQNIQNDSDSYHIELIMVTTATLY